MDKTQGLTDFFEEAEQEVNNSQTENSEDVTTEPNEAVDDIWNSDKPIDELFEKVANTEENVPTEHEPNVEEPQQQSSYQLVLTKPLKYRGKEIYVKTEDELIELAQKGMDYSLKMNRIKPYRELIDKLDSSNIDLNKLFEFVEALNGNESAKKNIINQFGSYSDDSDFIYNEPTTENNVVDNNVNQNEGKNFVDDIMKQLHSQNPEVYGKVLKVYNEIDNQFKYEIVQNENIFKSFVGSIIQGEFDEVYPYAVKEKSLNPHMSWIQAYIKGNEIRLNGGYTEPKTPEEPIQEDVKNVKKQPKTIKEKYDEIWDSKHSIEELEQMLIQEI